MSETEIKKIRDKLFKGLRLARKKAIEDAIKNGTKLVINQDGKTVLVDPSKHAS